MPASNPVGLAPVAPVPVALVTGASRGIGRAIAVALAEAGHDVAVNYARNAQAAGEVAGEIQAAGRRALLVQADIALAADRQRLLDETLNGLGRVDVLVNNAGVAPDVRADLLDETEASFDRLIDINLKGPFLLTQLVARHMIKQAPVSATGATEAPRRPKVVFISSLSAYAPSVNRGGYCIAKAGLSMTAALYASRLAEHGVNVYEVRPGIIQTDMTGPVKEKYDALIAQGLTPIQRWGTPQDVARAVVAIATDLLPFSTGEVINVDGGFHLRRL